jgi:hypothetical protein
MLVASLLTLGLIVGSASAKELVLRGEYHLLPDRCKSQAGEQIAIVDLFAVKYKCGSPGTAAAVAPMQGYWLEKLKQNKCERDRRANLYIGGSYYETREFNEFHINGAEFSPSKTPGTTGDEPWPAGDAEVIAPRIVFHAKVFKDNGESQSKAKSYGAKVVCEKLSLDLGSLALPKTPSN